VILTPEQQNELGLNHVSCKEYEQAEFHFSQAASSSGNPVYYFNAGKACAEQMKLEEAESFFRRAIMICDSYSAAHYELSLVLALQGKWDEFFKEYEWRHEYFSDLRYYRDMYSFGRKVLVCKIGPYRNFLVLPSLCN
jgi:tetratricopeptide (TPR) repeat protein